MDDWFEEKNERDKRFTRFRSEGLLQRAADELASIDEVQDFIALAYWVQRQEGGRLPLAVAEPDVIVERAVELAADLGIRDARLREVLKPLGKQRLERALWRLEAAEIIRRSKETRTDRRGSLRGQVIWHHCRLGTERAQ